MASNSFSIKRCFPFFKSILSIIILYKRTNISSCYFESFINFIFYKNNNFFFIKEVFFSLVSYTQETFSITELSSSSYPHPSTKPYVPYVLKQSATHRPEVFLHSLYVMAMLEQLSSFLNFYLYNRLYSTFYSFHYSSSQNVVNQFFQIIIFII